MNDKDKRGQHRNAPLSCVCTPGALGCGAMYASRSRIYTSCILLPCPVLFCPSTRGAHHRFPILYISSIAIQFTSPFPRTSKRRAIAVLVSDFVFVTFFGRSCTNRHRRRPPPLESRPPRAETSPTRGSLGRASGKTTAGGEAGTADRASRGGSTAGSLAGVDLEEELEHVHLELRNFLNKKRARKAGAAEGTPGKGGQVRC